MHLLWLFFNFISATAPDHHQLQAAISSAPHGEYKVKNNQLKETEWKQMTQICHKLWIGRAPEKVFEPPDQKGGQRKYKQTFTQSDSQALPEQIRSAANNPMNSCLQQG